MAAIDSAARLDRSGARVRAAQRACELAECCFAQNWIADALRYDREALRLGVDSEAGAFRRWACCMMLGDFERAWEETDRSEAQRKASGQNTLDSPLHERRVWDGSSLIGKRVMVRCFHGLGDTIQFARFLPSLCSVAERVTVQAQRPLLALLESIPGIESFVPLDPLDGIGPSAGFDVEIELMELPYAFRTTLATLPCDVPYLRVPPDLVSHRREELSCAGLNADSLTVGLVWSSGTWNPERNVPLAEFSRICGIRGLRFLSLQRGFAAQIDADQCPLNLIPTEHESGTPLDTAAAILNLDLVISVDTMVAHLAGALGKPVWTLLPFRADWRWMLDREDSPWYPTMRLFRQPRPGAWEPLIERVANDLSQLARA